MFTLILAYAIYKALKNNNGAQVIPFIMLIVPFGLADTVISMFILHYIGA